MLTLKAKLIGVYKANNKIVLQLQTTNKQDDTKEITIPNEKLPIYKTKIAQEVKVSVRIEGQYKFYGI